MAGYDDLCFCLVGQAEVIIDNLPVLDMVTILDSLMVLLGCLNLMKVNGFMTFIGAV